MATTTQTTEQTPERARAGVFVRFTDAVARLTGSSIATIIAAAIILAWVVSGPLFHFSNTWQLVINTGTTVITFLMVFVIQATQIRDSTALHVKLDELIAVTAGASNRAIGIERVNEREIDEMREDLEQKAASAADDEPSPGNGV